MRARRLSGLVLIASLLAGGCGASDAGPYHLSGRVAFDGKPLPSGRLFFLPDSVKGNSGQGGFAEIKQGVFDTRKKGSGTPGGALVVRIDGFDGKTSPTNFVGQPLFLTYEVRVEVPRAHVRLDFDVPAAAAKGLSKATGPAP
jgi:hypothetical protein